MADAKDLYGILGVDRGADDRALKKAYKRLAMKYHPDRNKGQDAEDRFKEIQQAYSVLSDGEKRAAYDRFGTTDFSGFGGGGGGNPFSGFGDFSDIFEDLFRDGSARTSRRNTQGRDLRIQIEIDLEEAINGHTTTTTINAYATCKSCAGDGARAGSRKVTCSRCQGTGQVQRRVAILVMQETCTQCAGNGELNEDPCPDCDGSGRLREPNEVTIEIPAGVDNGDTLRLQGKGEAGIANGPAGDLLVSVSVRPHPIFVRHGENINCRLPISFATATLGGEVRVPTLSGYKKAVVPKGMQSGQRIKIRGAGVKNLRSSHRGDQFCVVEVETPKNLTKQQEELLRKFEDTLQDNPAKHSPNRSSWLDRVKRKLAD